MRPLRLSQASAFAKERRLEGGMSPRVRKTWDQSLWVRRAASCQALQTRLRVRTPWSGEVSRTLIPVSLEQLSVNIAPRISAGSRRTGDAMVLVF